MFVVVFHADELFIESYSGLFEGTVIQDGSVYQVAQKESDISLELVGQTEIKGWH